MKGNVEIREFKFEYKLGSSSFFYLVILLKIATVQNSRLQGLSQVVASQAVVMNGEFGLMSSFLNVPTGQLPGDNRHAPA